MLNSKAPSKLTRQSYLIALFESASGGSVKYSIVRLMVLVKKKYRNYTMLVHSRRT